MPAPMMTIRGVDAMRFLLLNLDNGRLRPVERLL
jgi:hypothetical protein